MDKLLLISEDPYGVDSCAGWRVLAECPASMEVLAREWWANDLDNGALLLAEEEAENDPTLTDALLAYELEQDQANENDLELLRFATDLEETEDLVAVLA